ncbi:phage major tail tube protein [Campylobacter jejuni]|nr:phage major tail tube protein [Campylobacter jejuni]
MKRIIGEVIQEGNIYIDGQGYLGVVRNLKLPDIEQEMIETKGVLGANYSSGVLKPLEISFKLAVVDPVLYAAFFHTTFSEIKAPLLFRESVHKGGKNYGISAEFLGEFISISESDHESGKERWKLKLKWQFIFTCNAAITFQSLPTIIKTLF